MKGKNVFTELEIEALRELIRQREKADSSMQKRIRDKMRAIGFYGRDDFGIVDMTESDLDMLLESGRIKKIK